MQEKRLFKDRNMTPNTRALLILSTALAGMAIASHHAYAADDDLNHRYSLFAGGVQAANAVLDLDQANNNYTYAFEGATQGWFGNLAPWSGYSITVGAISNGTPTPATHESVSAWKGDKKTKYYTYKGGGVSEYVEIEDGRRREKDLEPELTDNTVDILSAALSFQKQVAETGDCTGQKSIYDGKRRYLISLNTLSQENLTASAYNTYNGPALKCSIEIIPRGGDWGDKPRGWFWVQQQSQKRGMLPTVWLGTPEGSELPVPVKAMAKTGFGTLIMHIQN